MLKEVETAPLLRGFFVPDEPRVRTCRCCGFEGPETAFKKSGKGRSNTCKTCDSERKRSRRGEKIEAQRAKEAAKARDRYWRDPEKARARNRANARSERGREINRAAVAKYKAAHPERAEARKIALLAEKRGEIKRKETCEVLGCSYSDGLHRHHPNYQKPREVLYLCREHHETVHHRGPLRLKPGACRKIAKAPKPAALAA